jgi:choline-glycine betaine transporter
MAMTALTVVTLFLLFGVFDPDTAGTWFTGAKDTIIAGFKWYYILVVALFLFFAVYLMFSRIGTNITLRLMQHKVVEIFPWFLQVVIIEQNNILLVNMQRTAFCYGTINRDATRSQ